jgi:hypothetical protein
MEYASIAKIRARARPMLSEMIPNSSPPNPEETKVMDASPPAAAELKRNSCWIAVNAKA